MAITDNAELKTAVANWSNRTDLTNKIPDFIRLAEARMVSDFAENGLQFKMAETETITTDANPKALDAGYRGTIMAYIDANPKVVLDYMTPDDFFSRYLSDQTGKPKAYTIRQQNMHFGPEADDSYSVIHWFLKMPDIATDTTNEILTNYPNLYLFGALSELHAYLRDEKERLYWEGRYQQAVDSLANEESNLGALQIYVRSAGAGAPRRYHR